MRDHVVAVWVLLCTHTVDLIRLVVDLRQLKDVLLSQLYEDGCNTVVERLNVASNVRQGCLSWGLTWRGLG